MQNNIKTDLAVELNEEISRKAGRLKGIIVNQHKDKDTGIEVTSLKVTNKAGERMIGKPMGTYITIEARKINEMNEDYNNNVTEILKNYISELIGELLKNKKVKDNGKDSRQDNKIPFSGGKNISSKRHISLLVAGLGNRDITSDSLGPLVAKKLYINGHIDNDDTGLCVYSIIPGVMGDTGMETADIIKGIAKQINPSVIIAIDALAARNIERLNTTIQLSDMGINPGSGVGNHRVGINYENIGIPVLAIGVPTVIDALTIVTDLVSPLIGDCSADEIAAFFSGIDNNMKDMYVTPKAIDQDIKNISAIISSAINNLEQAGISR